MADVNLVRPVGVVETVEVFQVSLQSPDFLIGREFTRIIAIGDASPNNFRSADRL